jgi:hypothetical protein
MSFFCRRSPAVAVIRCASTSRTRDEGLLASYDHRPVPQCREQPAQCQGLDTGDRGELWRGDKGAATRQTSHRSGKPMILSNSAALP